MDRVTRLSTQVLKQHEEKFTTDFTENKKILGQLTIIRSKGLKNEMAGYITKHIKSIAAKKAKQEERKAEIEEEVEEQIDEPTEETVEEQTQEEESEDSTPQEIVIENQSEEPEKTEN